MFNTDSEQNKVATSLKNDNIIPSIIKDLFASKCKPCTIFALDKKSVWAVNKECSQSKLAE